MAKASTKKVVPKTPTRRPLSRSLRLYQHIAVAFVIVTFLLLLGVLYLSVSRATIKVVGDPKDIEASAQVSVVPNPTEPGQLLGAVASGSFNKTKLYQLPAEGARQIEGKAGGTVTLINESNVAQPLVATTRLISQEGVLFRIQSSVNVPAHGEIEVLALADAPGKSGEIPASRFTIPGLSLSQQKEIYAESHQAMTGGVQYVRTLTQEDIDKAVNELSEELLAEAKESLRVGIDRAKLDGEAYQVSDERHSVDAEVGEEVGSFSLSLSEKVVVAYYPKSEIQVYSERLLAKEVPEGFRVLSVDDSLGAKVVSIDPEAKTAIINLSLTGQAIIAEDAQALDKDRFVGRAPHEVLTLLQSSEAIQSASVSFTPFWLKRVPTLQDHIKIVIEVPKDKK